ncbi:MAG: cell wall-binding repeat-containing protein, partial [Coriobacteriales bacterium]
SLKSFVIPSTVTSIGSYMFSSDYKLKSVTFEEPVQITTIPEACFNACYGLETVTIPRTVTNIAKWAFYNDTEISVVMLNKGDFTVDSTAFDFDFKELGLYTSNAKIYGYSTSTSPTAANECDVTFRPIDVTVTASWDSENEIWTNQKLELSATVNAKSGDAACQWYVNDEPIDGATSSTYTFSSTEAGTYILSLKCNNSTYDPTDPAPEVRYAVVHVYDKASIDRTGLDEAINVATEDLESTKMSEDGSDVVAEDSWVSEDVYNELQDAIDEATAVNANEDSKQSQINTATDTLNAAVEKFDAAKSAGKADRTWERISGSNRYETMAMISSNEFDSCKHAVLASGENFPDALAANGLAGSYGSPVILTTSDSLSYEAKAELERLGVKSVDIMGGEAAVSKNVVEELEDMGISVTRVSGSDRVQTSIASYKKIRVTADMGEKPDTVIIASGDSFADALSVGPLAYANKYPLVLVSNGTLSDDAVEEIMGDDNIENVIIVGGEAAVSSNVENQLAGNGYNFTRLSGSNRYETSAAIAKYSLDNGLTLSQPAVATGDNFPDALAASSMCGANRSVLLLVSSDGHEAIDVMNPQSSSIARGWIIGGEKAVPESVGRNIAGSLDMHLKL